MQKIVSDNQRLANGRTAQGSTTQSAPLVSPSRAGPRTFIHLSPHTPSLPSRSGRPALPGCTEFGARLDKCHRVALEKKEICETNPFDASTGN